MTRSNPKLGEIQRLILYHTISIVEEATQIMNEGKYPGRIIWGRDRVSIRVLRDRILLGDELGVSASQRASFSRSLKQLELRGFVVSWNHIHNRPGYTTHISLSEQGQKLAEEIKAKG